MPFYPDEGNEDDLKVENRYNMDAELETDDSDSFLVGEQKKDSKSGIDQEELKKRIQSFTLDSDSQNNSQSEDMIIEDDEGVPQVQKGTWSRENIIKKTKDFKDDLLEGDRSRLPKFFFRNKRSRTRTNESLGWYVKISRLPIFLIVSYSVLVLVRGYLITISSGLTNFAQNAHWFDSMKWPFEILIFLLTTYVIVKKRKQLPRIAGIAGIIIGFSAGVIISVIKLFWYREMWNIFYLSSESIFLGLIGLVVALLSSALFYEEEK